jgi:hypothetical protein
LLLILLVNLPLKPVDLFEYFLVLLLLYHLSALVLVVLDLLPELLLLPIKLVLHIFGPRDCFVKVAYEFSVLFSQPINGLIFLL